MMKKFIFIFLMMALLMPGQGLAACTKCLGCKPLTQDCSKISRDESQKTAQHITDEWFVHRQWIIKDFWEKLLLPALMLMTEQLTAAAMFQTQVIGTFFDAKHQLETQRLFQELSAQAHKDYQPSEGLCSIGTNMRSLAASDRNAEFTGAVISTRNLSRQTLNGDSISGNDSTSDRDSRFAQFISTYCDPKDNAGGFDLLCGSGGGDRRPNKDIDFTTTLDAPLTLEVDFEGGGEATPDEQDLLALSANLYGHKLPPVILKDSLYVDENDAVSNGVEFLHDMRAITAKRSVAQNSFAAMAAQKAQGEKEVQPYLYKILEEMGVPKKDVETILGERPSYYAQMEVLTKKLYQDPNFYTDLYDKPANVKRKEVAMQATDLMQKRDTFRSLLRTEANLSIMLELLVAEEQRVIEDEVLKGSR